MTSAMIRFVSPRTPITVGWGDEQVHSDVLGSGGDDVAWNQSGGQVRLDVEAVDAVDRAHPSVIIGGVLHAAEVVADSGLVESGHLPVVGARVGQPHVDVLGIPVEIQGSDVDGARFC